jgi:hypothetical protein
MREKRNERWQRQFKCRVAVASSALVLLLFPNGHAQQQALDELMGQAVIAPEVDPRPFVHEEITEGPLLTKSCKINESKEATALRANWEYIVRFLELNNKGDKRSELENFELQLYLDPAGALSIQNRVTGSPEALAYLNVVLRGPHEYHKTIALTQIDIIANSRQLFDALAAAALAGDSDNRKQAGWLFDCRLFGIPCWRERGPRNMPEAVQQEWVALWEERTLYYGIADAPGLTAHLADMMFARIEHILRVRAETLTRWVYLQDPSAHQTANFFLRLNEFGLLKRALQNDPTLADSLASRLFALKSSADIANRILLYGAFLQTANREFTPVQWRRFWNGITLLVDKDQLGPEEKGVVLDLLHLYAPSLSLEQQGWVLQRMAQFGRLIDRSIPNQTRPSLRPGDTLKASAHFTQTAHFHESLRTWQEKFGYRLVRHKDAEALLEREINGRKIIILMWLYPEIMPGNGPSYLDPKSQASFESRWQQDSNDPDIQVISLRSHSGMLPHQPILTQENLTKTFFLGNCRSLEQAAAWAGNSAGAIANIIATTRASYGVVNNQMFAIILEGLARDQDWATIRERTERALPVAAKGFIWPDDPGFLYYKHIAAH